MENERPEGIIKTLPTLYAADKSMAKSNFERSMKAIEAGRLDHFYIYLAGRPKYTVLYIYILIEGQIRVRANIAEIQKVDEEMDSWDGTKRKVKYMAVCSGPISYPPAPIYRKGFQGIRYTDKLW